MEESFLLKDTLWKLSYLSDSGGSSDENIDKNFEFLGDSPTAMEESDEENKKSENEGLSPIPGLKYYISS